MDATEEKDLAQQFGVKGYPTLKWFPTGDVKDVQDYGGGRTADTIVSWLLSRELPALSVLEDAAELEAFKEKHDLIVVAVTSDAAKIEVMQAFADANRDDVVCVVVKGDADKLSIHRSFEGEDPVVDYSGEWEAEAILEFVNAERFPLFAEINQQNFQGYMARGLPLAWLAVDPSETETFEKITAAVVGSGAAKSVAGKVSITWIDNSKFDKHVESLGIDSIPGLIVIHENDKWKFTGDLTDADAVSAWWKKWAAGEVDKFLKSEPVPEDPMDEGVYVLVGKSFDEVVNSDKDVFVEFYAPWCGHCKQLAPEYVKVAAAFKEVSDVVIAKVDATANDTPEAVQGFPTLVFYAKGKGVGEGEKYQGGRTAKDIVDWIEENGSTDVAPNKEEL